MNVSNARRRRNEWLTSQSQTPSAFTVSFATKSLSNTECSMRVRVPVSKSVLPSETSLLSYCQGCDKMQGMTGYLLKL